MFEHDFTKDFDRLVTDSEPFAFVRFHDGEHAILESIPYRAASKWTSAGKDVWFQAELLEVLKSKLDRFFMGISPPCCTPQATSYYRKTLGGGFKEATFATLFQFKNYRRVKSLRKKFKDALLVGSGEGVDIRVPGNGVTHEWDIDAVVKEMMESERPVFVAAGPCANIIIHRYWTLQPQEKRQTVIDVGAAFDVEIHKEETREYHKRASKTHKHVCSWDEWQPFGPVTGRQRRDADARSEAQSRFAALEEQGVSSHVTKRNKPEKAPVKSASNILVETRDPKPLGSKNPIRRARRTAKNLLG